VHLGVPLTLLGPVFFAVFIHRFQILPEERVMSAKFGQEYDDYRERVRRWL
jgi:protein-S-isoprenylcysteine O-methyltransferase Ste14